MQQKVKINFMKKNIILFVIIFLFKTKLFGQNVEFDSVKVFTQNFYEICEHLNKDNLTAGGDSTKIFDSLTTNQLFRQLINLKKNSNAYQLKKLRKEYNSKNINVRAVFVFYQKLETTIIGISPQPIIFINDKVYEKKELRLEDIVKISPMLYKNLFPTKEELIRQD